VEKIGIELLMARNHGKVLSANIDFYSGFVYDMMGLPMELYTPFFAVSRVSGWGAHRMEELTSGGKLIRPRYECVEGKRDYTPWIKDKKSGDIHCEYPRFFLQSVTAALRIRCRPALQRPLRRLPRLR
jgi:hypothetical protein